MAKIITSGGKAITYNGQAIGDNNLTAENIKKDVTIFGVVGTYEGGGAAEGDITFYDYDGSIVESWSLSELQSKTALPSNPSHTGLVAQGWNWSLADLKTQNTKMNVGQMYKTSSGLTEIDITLTRVTGLTVNCLMVGNKDWGDGTTDSATSHTYANYGDYTITCDGTSIPDGSSSAGGMFGQVARTVHGYYCTAIRIGENVTSIGTYAFYCCYSLTSMTIPSSVTSIGIYAFYNCYSLTSMTIPSSVTSIGTYAFHCCYSPTSVTIPSSVTSIGIYAFYYCFSLTSMTIPSSVTSIGMYAFCFCTSLTSVKMPQGIARIDEKSFYSCYVNRKYDFSSATAVPILANTSAFTGINGICKIVVPDSLYDTWIVATNWSTYANYIYKASEVE